MIVHRPIGIILWLVLATRCEYFNGAVYRAMKQDNSTDIGNLILKLLTLLLASFSLCLPQVLASSVLVGYVDVSRLIDESAQSVAAAQRLEREFAPRQNEINQGRDTLSELQERLQKEDLVISAEQKEEIALSIRALERKLKREEQDFREELSIKKNNEFKKVRQLALDVIAQFANANGYSLIISEGVLFADRQIDVTDKILKMMQEINDSVQ